MNIKILYIFLFLLLCLVLSYLLYKNKEGFTSNNILDTFSYINNDENTDENNIENFDNYNHYNGSSTSIQNGTTLYNSKGGTLIVNVSSDGKLTLEVRKSPNDEPVIFKQSNSSSNSLNNKTLYGPNNSTATIGFNYKGIPLIKISDVNGATTYTTLENTKTLTSTQYYGSTGSIPPYGKYMVYDTKDENKDEDKEDKMKDKKEDEEEDDYDYKDYDKYNKDDYEKIINYIQNKIKEISKSTNNIDKNINNNVETNETDFGISQNQIAPGNGDLYILKTQVLPPLCPACPNYPKIDFSNKNKSNTNQSNNTTSSCNLDDSKSTYIGPAAYEGCTSCSTNNNNNYENNNKKYSASNQYLPVPILADFTTFGM